jgi:hypothetical protein
MPTDRKHGGAELVKAPLNLPGGFRGLNTQEDGAILSFEWATTLYNTVLDSGSRVTARKGWRGLSTPIPAPACKEYLCSSYGDALVALGPTGYFPGTKGTAGLVGGDPTNGGRIINEGSGAGGDLLIQSAATALDPSYEPKPLPNDSCTDTSYRMAGSQDTAYSTDAVVTGQSGEGTITLAWEAADSGALAFKCAWFDNTNNTSISIGGAGSSVNVTIRTRVQTSAGSSDGAIDSTSYNFQAGGAVKHIQLVWTTSGSFETATTTVKAYRDWDSSTVLWETTQDGTINAQGQNVQFRYDMYVNVLGGLNTTNVAMYEFAASAAQMLTVREEYLRSFVGYEDPAPQCQSDCKVYECNAVGTYLSTQSATFGSYYPLYDPTIYSNWNQPPIRYSGEDIGLDWDPAGNSGTNWTFPILKTQADPYAKCVEGTEDIATEYVYFYPDASTTVQLITDKPSWLAIPVTDPISMSFYGWSITTPPTGSGNGSQIDFISNLGYRAGHLVSGAGGQESPLADRVNMTRDGDDENFTWFNESWKLPDGHALSSHHTYGFARSGFKIVNNGSDGSPDPNDGIFVDIYMYVDGALIYSAIDAVVAQYTDAYQYTVTKDAAIAQFRVFNNMKGKVANVVINRQGMFADSLWAGVHEATLQEYPSYVDPNPNCAEAP